MIKKPIFNEAAVACAAESFQDTAKEIVAQIESRLSGKGPEKPLYVMMGELHQCSAPTFVAALVTDALKKKGYTIACGLEVPYDTVTKIYNEFLDVYKPDHATVVPQKPNQDVILKCLIWYMKMHHFQDLGTLKFKFLLDQNIPVSLNDNTRGALPYNKDPLTIRTRNNVICARAMAHARATTPDIYIQLCGNTHVAGCMNFKNREYAFKDSLVSLFKEDGQNVIGIILNHESVPLNLSPQCHEPGLVQFYTLDEPMLYGANRTIQAAWLEQILRHLAPDNTLDISQLRQFEEDCGVATVNYFNQPAPERSATPAASASAFHPMLSRTPA